MKSKETLLKYIDSLHSYLQHMLLMFNPDDFDQVFVQAIYVESIGMPFKFSPKTSKQLENKDSKDGKRKGFNKGKKSTIVQKDSDRPTCKHC